MNVQANDAEGNQEKLKEYEMVRGEVIEALKWQNSWSTFAVTAVITLLGFAIERKNTLELYLLPFVVLLLVSLKVNNLKCTTTVKVGYLITRLESADGFLWESCLNKYRSQEKANETRIQKMLELFETQEFTVLGLICLTMFGAAVYFQGLPMNPRYGVEIVACLICLVIICAISTDYWNINYKEVEDMKNIWGRLIRETEEEMRRNDRRTNQ